MNDRSGRGAARQDVTESRMSAFEARSREVAIQRLPAISEEPRWVNSTANVAKLDKPKPCARSGAGKKRNKE